jgi:four helix bundle protein
MGHEDLPVFVRWYRFLDWLFAATEKFPRSVRFTLSSRIDNLALDILEAIIEAAYSRRKADILSRANLNLEKLRVLLRICHDRKFLPVRPYEHAVKELHETGKMLGGWRKSRGRE